MPKYRSYREALSVPMQIQVTESAPQRRWKLMKLRSFMIMGVSKGGGKWAKRFTGKSIFEKTL